MSSRIKYYVRYGVSWSQIVSVIISKSNRVGTMEHINVSWVMLLTKETKTTLLGSTITFTMDQRQVSLTNFFQPQFENNEVSSSMHVFTYQSCWFRVWRKTISLYVSLDVMSNDILLDILANFCCFPFFCFVYCCCFFLLWFCIFVLLFVFFFHVRVTVSQTLARTTRLAKAVLPTKVIAVCVHLDSRVRFAMKVMPFSKRVIPSKTLLIIETNVKLKTVSMIIEINMIWFQILTNVLQKSKTAVPMLFAEIPKYRTTVHVNLDIPEMEGIAEVDFAFWLLCTVNMFLAW